MKCSYWLNISSILNYNSGVFLSFVQNYHLRMLTRLTFSIVIYDKVALFSPSPLEFNNFFRVFWRLDELLITIHDFKVMCNKLTETINRFIEKKYACGVAKKHEHSLLTIADDILFESNFRVNVSSRTTLNLGTTVVSIQGLTLGASKRVLCLESENFCLVKNATSFIL